MVVGIEPADKRQQLPTGREQQLDNLPGHLCHRGTDNDHISLDRAEHIAWLTRPTRVIVGFPATVISPCRAWLAALLIVTTTDSKSADGSCTAMAARPCTWA